MRKFKLMPAACGFATVGACSVSIHSRMLAMRSITLSFVMFVGAGCSATVVDAGYPGQSPPPPQRADEPAQAPSDGKLSADSSLDDILDALDRRGEDLQSLAADVTLTESDAAL